MFSLNNFKIGTRLAGAFIAVILLLLGISYTGWQSSTKMFGSLVDMYDDSVVPLRTLSDMQFLASRNRILVMDMIINTDPANVAKRTAEMGKNSEKIDKAWSVYLGTNLAPEEKALIAEIEPALMAYRKDGLLPARDASQAGKHDEALAIYKTKSARWHPNFLTR